MKARRILGLVALAAMALGTSCSNDELYNDYSPENAISFGTYVGRDADTRATVIDEAKLKNDDFGVFAYYTGDNTFKQVNTTITPNFMYNEKVEWNDTDNAWTYSPIKYWPTTTSHMISFFAFAPYDNDLELDEERHDDSEDTRRNANITYSANTATGSPTVTYKVPAAVGEQIDLLYAQPILNQTRMGTKDKVKFNFKHALARIGFSVEAMIDVVNSDATNGTTDGAYGEGNTDNGTIIPDGTTITVKKVTLKDVFYTKATYTFTTYDDSNNTMKGLWTTRLEKKNNEYVLKKEGDVNNFKISQEEVTETVNGQSSTKTVQVDHAKVTNAKKQLNADDSYIMIIPQNNENEDRKIQIEVVYDVETIDNKLAGGKSTITNTVITESFDFDFLKGKAYDFVLHIGLTSVQFNATVDAWDPEDGSDYVVNVPINVDTTTTTSTSNEP